MGSILDDPAGNGTSFRNDKLNLTLSATDVIVRGGEKIRLFVDVRLQKGMHVYAPGVEGYIPISWTMSGNALEESGTMHAPAARRLHLRAIGETVPVFENEFRLYRDVVIGGAKQVATAHRPDGTLVLEGEFRYQACDDRKCYVPETVPLRWTLRYEPHDSTRVPPEMRRTK